MSKGVYVDLLKVRWCFFSSGRLEMIPGCGVSYCDRHLGDPESTSQSYCLPRETRKSKWIKVNTCRNQNRDVKRTAGPNMRCLCHNTTKSSGREYRLLVSPLSWRHSCMVNALRKAWPWDQGGNREAAWWAACSDGCHRGPQMDLHEPRLGHMAPR